MRRVLALVLVVFLVAACSSNDLADQGNRSRAGKERNAGGGPGKTKRDKGNPKGDGTKRGVAAGADGGEEVPEEIGSAGSADASDGASAPQDFGGSDAPSSGVDPSLARAGAGAEDPTTDAKTQGVTPPYAEVTGAHIQGLGKNVRFTMTFNGTVPDRVQKDQYFVLAFGVTGQKEGEGFAVGAACDEDGWNPYAGAKGQNQKFPGRFEISGNTVIMEVPWSLVKGPRAFEWYASGGWYGKVANQTHWSFDGVPNKAAGRFPS